LELRKLSRAVEQSPSIITIADSEGNIEYVNPKFTQVTGYAFEEVIGKNPRILKSGETPPEEYKRLWEAITSGREWRGEFHNKKKNGELYWASASISPIRDREGLITHFLGVEEDITERKRAEEEIRSLNVELERRVAEQERSLLELSTPVVTLWDEIVLLPLIGVVDTERAQQLIEALLNAIVETQSRVVILDITGVPGIDTSVAQHLIKSVAAARMLGADVIVTGVSPEAAQALVKLGVDLGGMRTRGTLRTGLAEALSLTGRQVVSL
jgi:PAS domain S-box-containing protein